MTLWIDPTHRFCLDETPQIRARIRADLEAITEIILEAVPEASIVLSGSLAYGEARIEPDGLLPRSDYDLYIVVPRLLEVGRLLGPRSRCVQRLRSLTLLTDLEIVVIWTPFIWRGLTHIPGILLTGSPAINPLLEQPRRFPYGDRALCRAYACILDAARQGSDQGVLQKAVIIGFRAWLLDRVRGGGSWHNQDLFSFRGNLTYLREHPGELQEPWQQIAKSAILAGVGDSIPHETLDPKTVLAFLKWVQGTIRLSPLRWIGLLYPVFQMRRGRSFIRPHRFTSTYLMLASSLAEVYSSDGTACIPSGIMRGIEHLAGVACPSQAGADQKGWAIDEMIALANANPHKIFIPRRERSVTNLTPHS